MTPLPIDFAPRSLQRAIFRVRPAGWLAIIAGIVLCASALVTAERMLKQQQRLDASLKEIQEKQAERTTPRVVPKTVTISAGKAASVNHAILQMNLPWRDMLDAIEAATPASIALVALDPDAKKHVVRGTAESQTSDDMIAYIEALKKQDFFTAVVLTGHEVNDRDSNRPLRFQFEAQWTEQAK